MTVQLRDYVVLHRETIRPLKYQVGPLVEDGLSIVSATFGLRPEGYEHDVYFGDCGFNNEDLDEAGNVVATVEAVLDLHTLITLTEPAGVIYEPTPLDPSLRGGAMVRHPDVSGPALRSGCDLDAPGEPPLFLRGGCLLSSPDPISTPPSVGSGAALRCAFPAGHYWLYYKVRLNTGAEDVFALPVKIVEYTRG